MAEGQCTVIIAGLFSCLVGHSLNYLDVITQRRQRNSEAGPGEFASLGAGSHTRIGL